MKSKPQPRKSQSFQLLKSPSNQPGKIRKTKSMTPELPQSKSRKISMEQVPRRSPRISQTSEISMESTLESSGTKRKILTDSPVNVKRFKDSHGKSVQDSQAAADLDDLPKVLSNAKENETVAGMELNLRSADDRPIILIAAAHTWNKKKEVKAVEPEVKGSADICQEVESSDASMESDLDAISTPSGINESENFVSTFEMSGYEGSKTLEASLNEAGGIFVVEQPSFVRSSVGSEGGQVSSELEIDQVAVETEEVDVETASDAVETEEEDNCIGNNQDLTAPIVDSEGHEIGSHATVDLESESAPESSSGKADVALEESKGDADDAKIDQANLGPEVPAGGKSNEFDAKPNGEINAKSNEEINAKSNEELDAKSNEESDAKSNEESNTKSNEQSDAETTLLRCLSFNDEESTLNLSTSNDTSSINFEETLASNITSDSVSMETVAKVLSFDTEDSVMDETNTTTNSLQFEDQEMEQDNETLAESTVGSKSTNEADMSKVMTSTPSGQVIRNVGVNEISLDESSLAGPSGVENLTASSFMMPQDSERIHQYQRVTRIERVVPAADGKEAVLTHESVRNYTLHLSSGDDAPNLSSADGNMLDSLFHDEGDEEMERITMAWNEAQLRMQQCNNNSGQTGWNPMEDDSDLYTILAMILVFLILFIAKHLVEAVRSVPPF